MSVSTRDGQAPARPEVPEGEPEPTAAPTEVAQPSLPAPVMPVVSGLVVLSSEDAPMCSDGVCL